MPFTRVADLVAYWLIGWPVEVPYRMAGDLEHWTKFSVKTSHWWSKFDHLCVQTRDKRISLAIWVAFLVKFFEEELLVCMVNFRHFQAFRAKFACRLRTSQKRHQLQKKSNFFAFKSSFILEKNLNFFAKCEKLLHRKMSILFELIFQTTATSLPVCAG